jgi:predicted ester cyclase
MSIEEENKATMRRVFEDALGKGNLEIIPELVAPEYKIISPLGVEAKGPEGFRDMVVAFRTAFPDLDIQIENIIAEGDYVALHYNMSGTFQGDFTGMKPTGNPFSLPGAVFVRLSDGKEVEAVGFFDVLSFYQQLGVPITSQ